MKKFVALALVLALSLSLATSALAGDCTEEGVTWITSEGMVNRFYDRFGSIPIITYGVINTPEGDVLYAELSVPHRKNGGTPPTITVRFIEKRVMVEEEIFLNFLEQHASFFECLPWEMVERGYTPAEASLMLEAKMGESPYISLTTTTTGFGWVEMEVKGELFKVELPEAWEGTTIPSQTMTDLLREWQER